MVIRLCYAVLSVPCNLVITCWEKADLLALLCVVFSCVFVTFPYGVPRQVWYLIGSTPGPKVIKLESILKLKIKPNDWLIAGTCPQSANRCALYAISQSLRFILTRVE